MRSVWRAWSGVTLLLVLGSGPIVAAQDEPLQAASKLYEKQEYKAAQEALLKVDREALTEVERAKLDELLKLLPEAINGSEKAAQDLADGDAAFDAGDWDAAERHFQALQANKYATPETRERAATQGARIAEKRRLAEAAKPSGPVEGTPGTSLAGETPAPPGATPTPPTGPGQAEPEALPRRLTPTDELRMRDELLWQRAVAIAEALVGEARTDIANQDFAAARLKAATALQTVEAAAPYAEPISKYQAA